MRSPVRNLGIVAAAVAGGVAHDLGRGGSPAIASMRVDQWLGTRKPPPQTQRHFPVEAGLTLLALASLLSVAVLGSKRRRLRPGPREMGPSSLLPQSRRGATPHERLHDPTDVERILEAELSGTRTCGKPESQQPEGPMNGSSGDESATPPQRQPS